MKVILRDHESGLFLLEDGRWTASRIEAYDFKHSARAVLRALELKLKSVEVLLAFEEKSLDVYLPVGACAPRQDEVAAAVWH